MGASKASDFGFKFIFMGGAGGAGVAVNNATKAAIVIYVLTLDESLLSLAAANNYC